MHRIKTVLTSLAIMLMALTSFKGIVIAAQVQGIHKNGRFVFIGWNKQRRGRVRLRVWIRVFI